MLFMQCPGGMRVAACVAVAWGMAGCASFSADGGLGSVRQTVRERIAQDVAPAPGSDVRARLDTLFADPLSADTAVQIALLNNRGLQASLAELGVAEADLVEAGSLPNLGLRYGRNRRGDSVEIDRGLQIDLVRLLTMPLATQVETRRFEQLQRDLTITVLNLAARTRQAWVLAVAAEEQLRYAHQVVKSTAAGSELARRMAQSGNGSKLDQSKEEAFRADAVLDVHLAERTRIVARERLTRLLGASGKQLGFTLPERLPDLPHELDAEPDVEQVAMDRRLDVQAAALRAEQTARNVGLTRVTRFINVFDFGVMANSKSGEGLQRGYQVQLSLPLFDAGSAQLKRAESIYLQAVEAAAHTAVDARSQVREAYAAYRVGFDIARHHREALLPLKKRISEENLLRYNGMQISVFELLADTRAQIVGVTRAIDALRDFWLADAQLQMALAGPSEAFAP